MFTGIIERTAPVCRADHRDGALELAVEAPDWATELALGESVAVNGVCLTVARFEGEALVFQAGAETLGLTTLGALRMGERVNLERALRVGQPLGGHFVSGHVDGVGRIRALTPEPGQTRLEVELPERLAGQVILKGSIAIDGISLTITSVVGCVVSIALIPHTLAVTNLGTREVGAAVNIETDMLAKWILQRLDPILADRRIDPGKAQE